MMKEKIVFQIIRIVGGLSLVIGMGSFVAFLVPINEDPFVANLRDISTISWLIFFSTVFLGALIIENESRNM